MIEYSKATIEDLPGILSLYKQWAEEEKAWEHEIEAAKAEAVWQEAAAKGVTYFIAKDTGTVIAACYVSIIPNLTWGGRPIAFIENLITCKEYRRQGIGKAIMKMAIEYAKDCGCYKATLQSNAKRRGAHALYHSIGFDGDPKIAFDMRLTKN